MTPSTQEALTAATEIAEALIDPHAVSALPTTNGAGRRRAQSLAGGAAGTALLHIQRAHTGHGDWTTAHSWLATVASENLSAGGNAGLYFGVPTLAFLTANASAERPDRYTRALAALDTSTITITRHRLDQACQRLRESHRPALAEFDLLRGLTGLGAYHLYRHPHHDITRAVLTYLVALTEPASDGLPGWWTDVSPTGEPSPAFPGGHGNLGMAHGIAAPLTLLALALRDGVTVPGQHASIRGICDWLDTWRDRSGSWWPGFITTTHLSAKTVEPIARQRPSWCYGTPGLARAQQLAGLALDDTARQDTAETAMLACLNEPTQLCRITHIGLCHGLAGLLHTAHRMSTDARTPEIAAHLPTLITHLTNQLNTDTHDTEFLDGTTGAALALHTLSTPTAPTDWDRCLLLA